MAKIEEVRVDLKFSKEIAENEWMSIGLGATATVSSDETFEMAIQEVEHQLRVEMRQSWGRMRRDKPQEVPMQDEAAQVVGDEEIEEVYLEPPPEPPVDPSWCPIHKCKMKEWFAKDGSGRSWYSHPVGEKGAPDSFWCQGEEDR